MTANKCHPNNGYCSPEDYGCVSGPNESGGSGGSGGQSNCCQHGSTCVYVCGPTSCLPSIMCACDPGTFWEGQECCICPQWACGENCELEGENCPEGHPTRNSTMSRRHRTPVRHNVMEEDEDDESFSMSLTLSAKTNPMAWAYDKMNRAMKPRKDAFRQAQKQAQRAQLWTKGSNMSNKVKTEKTESKTKAEKMKEKLMHKLFKSSAGTEVDSKTKVRVH